MPMHMQQNREFGRNHDLHTRSIERVIRAISDRLHVSMSNDQMADIACFSPCHFNRLFHKVTGIPPVQFQYALRIARAKELLIETDGGITDICFDVGYNSLGTFISRFSELVGVSPSAFRRLARRIAGMCLADFPLSQLKLSAAPPRRGGIAGTIEHGACGSVIFTGLFRRAISEGWPSACALVCDEPDYTLPIPADGVWHVLSVGVPRSANGIQLLTLKGLVRGRSAPIVVQNGRWYGDGRIVLSLPSPLDPPMLAAIPIQIARLNGHSASAFHFSRTKEVPAGLSENLYAAQSQA